MLILAVALAIGWRPDASPATIMAARLLILLGTAAFGGLSGPADGRDLSWAILVRKSVGAVDGVEGLA